MRYALIMKNKKLKILLLTDRLGVGGAETHIISLCKALEERGHSVTVASSGGTLADKIRHVRIDLSSRSIFRLVKERFKLSRLLKEEKFDLIHAHARLPAFVCYPLAKKYRSAFLTTVHARFKADPIRRRLSRWGERTCAVSEDLKFYLTDRYSVSPYNVTVIENGIDTEYFSTVSPLSDSDGSKKIKKLEKSTQNTPFDTTKRENLPFDTTKRENLPLNTTKREKSPLNTTKREKSPFFSITFISRLDKDCSLSAFLLCDVLEALRERFGDVRLKIGGGGEMLSALKKRAAEINKRVGMEAISVFGELDGSKELLSESDIFVGVSRAAIEAAAMGVPVVISGNEGYLGRMTENNYRYAKTSNFCARGDKKPTAELLEKDISFVIENYSEAKNDARSLLFRVADELDIRNIAKKTEDFYYLGIEADRQRNIKFAETMLFGYYGYRNLGDDAMLKSAIERAKERFGESVGVFAYKPKRAERDFSVKCMSRKNPFSLFFGMLHAKRVIFGGGTLFQCSTSKRSLIFYICVLRMAQKMKKRTELWANGIGDIGEGRLKKILINTLKRCDRIGVRDEFSFKILKDELGEKEIILEKDLALSLGRATRERAEFLVKKAMRGSEKDFFIVSVKRKMAGDERFELENEIKKEKMKNRVPIFVVCSPNDIFATERAVKRFGGGMLENVTFSDMLGIAPMAKRVISARYHPLVAARASGVEVKAIGRDSKLKEF